MQKTDSPPMHVPRALRLLRDLLHGHRVAALGSLNADGSPLVSMVPYAIEAPSGAFVVHVSLLAPHTRNLLTDPRVGLMVMATEPDRDPVHALPRVSLEALAQRLQPESAAWVTARATYLDRFPEAEPMTALADFSFVALRVLSARHVAGFGSARPIDAEDLSWALTHPPEKTQAP